MNETRPRGEEPGAAGWDGVERCRATEPTGRTAWWSLDRLPGRIVVRVAGELGATAVLKAAQVLAEYFR
ncbi:hypothetical protein ACFWA9_04290 [Kitasatospora sp. NPDC059973]|uniref:hypothetical protein n=1 Tax=Kitasatospora sp. NPDC059973 TaxID=3347020 RepID=UPI00367926BF